MSCPKDSSKSSSSVSSIRDIKFVKEEDEQKFKLDQTARTTNFSIKQTSLLRWATLFEEIGTGQRSADLRKLFAVISKLNPVDYKTVKLVEATNRLDNLSFIIYGTPYLWWAIRLANLSKFETPFDTIPAGTNLNVIIRDALFDALREL